MVRLTGILTDALALGLRWVTVYGDGDIAKAASEVAGKVKQSLPPQLQTLFEDSTLLVGRTDSVNKDHQNMASLRSAIRRRLKVQISYTDRFGDDSERIIWPFALGYLSGDIILAAWCESRNNFRHFNVTQLNALQLMHEGYPHSRNRLLRMWRNAGLDTLEP